MSQIKITNLTFCYDGSYDNVFEDVSISLDTDWKLGLIGRNGKGKTTFLKLLLGAYAYCGRIDTTMPFQYFPFAIEDNTLLTLQVIDNIGNDYAYWELCKELSLLQVSEDVLYQPFNTLSYGEQTKVLLATLFIGGERFLLIDEPTNHLDLAGRQLVSKYLNRKKGFILVSHDISFVDRCVDHILSINKTTIDVQKGTFTSWQQNKDYKDQFELGKNERLKRNIKRLEKSSLRTAGWSDQIESSKIGGGAAKGYIGHKSAKMMKRAKSIEARKEKEIEEKSKLLKDIETTDDLIIKPLSYFKETVLEVNDVAIVYGEVAICKPITLTVKKGEKVAVVGKNGCGKSSLIKLLIGENIKHSGTCNLGSQMKVSYIPQGTDHLFGTLKAYAKNEGLDETIFKSTLKKLDFDEIQFEKDIKDFSEGQKKKVLLAKSISEDAHLYIWDEPLNFVDVLSRVQVEKMIVENEMTLLFIEHDEQFVDKIADKIGLIERLD